MPRKFYFRSPLLSGGITTPGKFIFARMQAKSGLALRSGIARAALAVGSQVVVTSQIVSFVDANGAPIILPETYEMSVIDGVEHSVPGVI